jgi:predicted NBD/HSP70 family sugar kinase
VIFVGIGLAGLVDHEHGIFKGGPNLPKNMIGFKFANYLKRSFGVPAAAENDARCFALAEARLGAGRGKRTVFGMTLGTGIGGGLVIDGRLVRGASDGAGEIGHIPVTDEPVPCGCGRTGHLEAVASGPALERIYRALSGRALSSKEIARRASKKERHAVRAFEAGQRALAIGFSTIQHLFDPDRIVVGGGLGQVRAYWSPAVRRAAALSGIASATRLRVLPAKLGLDAGIAGAALLKETHGISP